MLGRNLCSKCAVGRYLYSVDENEPCCPYVYCYNGKRCGMYKKIPNKNRGNIFDFFKKIFFKP